MYNIDEDRFEKCIEGQGRLFEQTYNMILIASVTALSVEDLAIVIEDYIEQKMFENNELQKALEL